MKKEELQVDIIKNEKYNNQHIHTKHTAGAQQQGGDDRGQNL